MKILKRVIAVAVIIALVLLVSYLIYTGRQVNAQGGSYHCNGIYLDYVRAVGRVRVFVVLSSVRGNVRGVWTSYRVLFL